jgi:hypothetical protein
MAAALLKQRVLAPVATIGCWICEVLRPVDLNGELEFGGIQVDFHLAPTVEGERKFCIEPEQTGGFRQGFEALEKECFAGTAGPSPFL